MTSKAYDVFNGDADGLCALLQLRLAEPREAELVTGVKRDIALLSRVPRHEAADITVLDISLSKNREALDQQLALGSRVFYVDHHDPGETPPRHVNFERHIDTDAQICTSLIVDRLLNGQYHAWAIAAAFGDNLVTIAEALCRNAGFDQRRAERLRMLGVCLNYNGYGSTIADLHFDPADLFRAMEGYSDPFDFMASAGETWQRLLGGYQQDLSHGLQISPEYSDGAVSVVKLPDMAWARRVSGPLGNELCNRNPDTAFGILTNNASGNFTVSIRAPLKNRTGANEVANRFATGGGRKAAAGINDLPQAELPAFIEAMKGRYNP